MANDHKQSVRFGDTEKLYCHLNKNGRKRYRKEIGATSELRGELEEYENVDLPAHKAALEGNLVALQSVFLWKNSSGIPALDIYGATPLHMAARRNHADIIKWLLHYSDLSVLDQAHELETPVHIAAALGYIESLMALLETKEKDAKLLLCGITDSQGFTPLLLAIKKHSNNTAKLLISELGNKAVSGFSVSGINAAHMAASTGNVEILKLLFNKYKNTLNLQSVDGATPVYFAAQEGQIEALRYLIDVANCDLSIPNNDGLKPIHAAAQAGHTSIVKFIIQKAGVNAIIERGPDGATPLHFAASAGVMRTAKWIVNCDSSGYLIGVTDNNGDTPAHDAAENKQVEMLAFLLDCGADLYATNKTGQSPYSNALSKGDPELSNVVMMFSADKPEGESGKGPDSEASDIIVSYGGYATISEMEESEGISNKKHARAQKRARNDLSDQELTNQILAEEAEMGFKPAFRSNPLSRFASTPPPTPATTQDGDDFDLPFLAMVENPYSIYSSINPEIIAKKRQAREMIILDTDPPPVPSQNFKGEETPNFAGQRRTSPSDWSLEEVPAIAIPPEADKVQIQEEFKEEKAEQDEDIKLHLEAEDEAHVLVDSDSASTVSTDDDKEALIITN